MTSDTHARRVSIEDRGTIAAMEDLFAMMAGVITATGGAFAIAGHDVRDSSIAERMRALTAMYDAGEIVVGYADARSGDVVNVVIEHLALGDGRDDIEARSVWRALVYVEEPEGHELRGVLTGRDWSALAQQLFDAVNDGLRRPLPMKRSALAGVRAV
jgi:hypothetical protein